LGKKVKISVALDSDLLEQLDNFVRKVQAENVSKGEKLTNRSAVVEIALLKFFSDQDRNASVGGGSS